MTLRRTTTIWECKFRNACFLKSYLHKGHGLCPAESVSREPECSRCGHATRALSRFGVRSRVPDAAEPLQLCLGARVTGSPAICTSGLSPADRPVPGLLCSVPISECVYLQGRSTSHHPWKPRMEEQLWFLTSVCRLQKPPLNSSDQVSQARGSRPSPPPKVVFTGKWRKAESARKGEMRGARRSAAIRSRRNPGGTSRPSLKPRRRGSPERELAINWWPGNKNQNVSRSQISGDNYLRP